MSLPQELIDALQQLTAGHIHMQNALQQQTNTNNRPSQITLNDDKNVPLFRGTVSSVSGIEPGPSATEFLHTMERMINQRQITEMEEKRNLVMKYVDMNYGTARTNIRTADLLNRATSWDEYKQAFLRMFDPQKRTNIHHLLVEMFNLPPPSRNHSDELSSIIPKIEGFMVQIIRILENDSKYQKSFTPREFAVTCAEAATLSYLNPECLNGIDRLPAYPYGPTFQTGCREGNR